MEARRSLFVALEASADRFAAGVLRELREEAAFAIGGAELAEAGATLVGDLRRFTAMGAVEVFRGLPALFESLVALWDELGSGDPAVAILVDGPEVNLPLAGWLTRRGVPVVYFVAPQVWAWRPGRVRALRANVRRLAVTLPFEEAPLREAGIDARFVGHPLVDTPLPTRSEARRRLALPEGLVVAVVPGSRPAEVARHLDLCLAAARKLGPAAVVVPRASSVPALPPIDAVVVPGPAGLALAAADVALVASGTATLESIVADTPPVILHKTSSVTFLLARALVRAPFVGLPNLVLSRRVFPELLQADATPENLARAAATLLEDPRRDEIAEVRARLGPPGVAARVADLVREVAR